MLDVLRSTRDQMEFFYDLGRDEDSFYQSLAGYFNLRNTLRALAEKGDESAQKELKIIENILGSAIVYFSAEPGPGLEPVARQLKYKGLVAKRSEAIQLTLPIYDALDNQKPVPRKFFVIGIVGKISSGKGQVGELISRHLKSMHMPISDRLREIAVSQGHLPPHSREALRTVNDQFKPKYGNSVFVNQTLTIARNLHQYITAPIITIDGFRSLEEAQDFRAQGFPLIGVEANADLRFQRLLTRNRGNDDFSREAFDLSDSKEGEWIDPIMDIVDFTLTNDGTVEELESRLLTVLDQIHETFNSVSPNLET